MIFSRFTSVRWKEYHELRYWKARKNAEGVLKNTWYEYFYTTHFGLDATYYTNKVLLDIGCGRVAVSSGPPWPLAASAWTRSRENI